MSGFVRRAVASMEVVGTTIANKPTRFGAVKVHASVLSKVLVFKTFVVTNETTAAELVAIVVNSYKPVCQGPQLFCLVLEKPCKEQVGIVRCEQLEDDALPLDMQATQARVETRFSLRLRPGTGAVAVDIKVLQDEGSCLPTSTSVFIDTSVTCRDVISLILASRKLQKDPAQYCLHLVDPNSEYGVALSRADQPLRLQQQWLRGNRSYHCVFQLRHSPQYTQENPVKRKKKHSALKNYRHSMRMRRTRSLTSLEDIRGPQRILEAWEARRSLHLKFGWRRGSQDLSSEDLSARTDDSSVAKLRENLLRLREHLDHVQKKAEIGEPSEDAAPLAGSPDPVDRIQIKELPDDQTKEENDKEDLAMMSSQQADYTIETNEDYVPNEGEPDEETPRVETINLKSVREEPSPARPNSADSLDESDHGVSPDTSHRGTNDSAYASDRHSYSSRQPRRLTGEDTSEDSATENEMTLRKSQSLLELEQGLKDTPPRPKPSRVKSASHATLQARARRLAREISGSDDQLNHKGLLRLSTGQAGPDAIRRTRSMHIASSFQNGRPTSAESSKSSVSSSSRSGNSKIRRSLPKLPQVGADAIEDRKRRLSTEIIKKAQDRELRASGSARAQRHVVESNGNESDESEFMNEVDLDSRGPTPLKTGLEGYYEQLSQEGSPPPYSYYDTDGQAMRTLSSSRTSTSTPREHSGAYTPRKHTGKYTPTGHMGQNHSSKDALQRIIKDLKDATVHSQDGSGSSDSPSSSSHDSRREYPYDYAQLAQWGVLEPSYDDMLVSGIHRPQPIQPVGRPEPQQELTVEHPSIFRLIKTCDLINVAVERKGHKRSRSFGIEVFESVFSDRQGRSKSRKRPIFRSPSGRRPLLGRNNSAFQPVGETGKILSLVAVDEIDDEGAAKTSGLFEGDFIVEVNGENVTSASPAEVRTRINASPDTLQLVVARPRPFDGSSSAGGSVDANGNVNKELEKMKFKYSAMKQDSEKSMDLIAELRLELQDRDHRLNDVEGELSVKDQQIRDLENLSQGRQEEINEWKYEANHRNMELARLKFETKKKDDRLTQLRRLLIQQSELMQLHQGQEPIDKELMQDFEEHISAV